MSDTQKMERFIEGVLAELQLRDTIFEVFRPPDRGNWCIILTPPNGGHFKITTDCQHAFAAESREHLKRQIQLHHGALG